MKGDAARQGRQPHGAGRSAVRAAIGFACLVFLGCEAAPRAAPLVAQQPLSGEEFATLVERISEAGGYFDTDNLISNETGYLKVVDALDRSGFRGGAYVGVGPDQNFSYIAATSPAVAFIVDIRRDNLLHHLLLKALVERAETRVEFLAELHGVVAPDDPSSWRERGVGEITTYIEGAPRALDLERLQSELAVSIDGFGVPLTEEDHVTIRQFHRAFIDAGLSLRFTSFGRAPRPYYPTYRQLVIETDIDGDQASYLASLESYAVVRALHLANRIVPVVGDLAGEHALRELGTVMREMDVELSTVYASNVEYYLWQDRTFPRWVENLSALPAAEGAVVIRSYFANFGRAHPSAVPGYYSTQSLQPVRTLLDSQFSSYWDVVTREIIELR